MRCSAATASRPRTQVISCSTGSSRCEGQGEGFHHTCKSGQSGRVGGSRRGGTSRTGRFRYERFRSPSPNARKIRPSLLTCNVAAAAAATAAGVSMWIVFHCK